jgi:hypothetical protein
VGYGVNAGEWYYDYYNFQIDPPVIDYWLDFDERHTVNANFDLLFPTDFFVLPFQDLSSSIVFSYHSGHPYSPEDLRGNRLGDENSARMPGYWNVDLNFSKRVAVGPVNLILSGLVYNLFNTEQINNVYTTTGQPDDHGDPEPLLSQFGSIPFSSTRYSPQADYDHDGLISPTEMKTDYMAAIADYYMDPRNYNNPLRIQLGIGIAF